MNVEYQYVVLTFVNNHNTIKPKPFVATSHLGYRGAPRNPKVQASSPLLCHIKSRMPHIN